MCFRSVWLKGYVAALYPQLVKLHLHSIPVLLPKEKGLIEWGWG